MDRKDKAITEHQEVVHDHDLNTDRDITSEKIASIACLSEEEKRIERQLVRKIDLLIMPLVILVYLLNYLDRNSYAAAKLQGLVESLHLNDTQYQTALSVLFVGYVSELRTLSVDVHCFVLIYD